MTAPTTDRALDPTIRSLVLEELPSLRLDREALEQALDDDDEDQQRIPSRKAIVIIARVCKKLGVGQVVKKADLRPEQVSNLRNLIVLLDERTTAHRSR